jgi:glutamate--cysteine ligase
LRVWGRAHRAGNDDKGIPLSTLLQRRLALLALDANRPLLAQGLRGIERETLRVRRDGSLAHSAHPPAWGSALTHPHITTDYAETLVEFITPAEHDIAVTLQKLDESHRYAYTELPDELLWSQSMPGNLPEESEIEIANYGTSNIGMLKHVYRRGLALRYGKSMQCIAGIHYNFSLAEPLWQLLRQEEGQSELTATEFQSESYIAMMRNFRRYGWLLMYLFGASPALPKSFLRGHPHQLDTLSDDTLYLPYGTSLRMSDLGYHNDAQSGLTPQENSLENYVTTLSAAVNKAYPPYQAIGTKRDGQWIQLSTNVLQIENEYYSTIRPKRVIRRGERPIQALCRRGVQYIEVRCMDVDPYEPLGVSLDTGRFLDVFLTFCALDESPLNTPQCGLEYQNNFATTVKEGRRPGLQLYRRGQPVALKEWGLSLLEQFKPVAELLDQQAGSDIHSKILQQQAAKLLDPALTPSARVLRDLASYDHSYPKFGLAMSERHAQTLRSTALSPELVEQYRHMAATSLAEQARMEAEPDVSLDQFITAYQNSTLCNPCD